MNEEDLFEFEQPSDLEDDEDIRAYCRRQEIPEHPVYLAMIKMFEDESNNLR